MSTKKICIISVVAAAALTGVSSFADTTASSATTATSSASSAVVDSSAVTTTTTTTKSTKHHHKTKKSTKTSDDARYRQLEQQVTALQDQVNHMQKIQKGFLGGKGYIAHGPAIVSSPYTNYEYGADFGGSDLLINLPSINKDVALLGIRKNIYNRYCQMGICGGPDRPVVAMSGKVEMQAHDMRDFDKHNESDLNLSAVELEAVAEVNPWITALMKMKFVPDNNDQELGSTVDNNKLQISEAFITIGNLDKSPIYASMGQMYVPFTFDNNLMVTDTLVKTIGKTKAQPLILGFTDVYGVYGSIYTFKGDSYESNPDMINQFGVDLGYKHVTNKSYLDVGAGYINNMADSEGMQSTPGSDINTFNGFGDNYKLKERVHGIDGHFLLGLGEKPKWSMYNPWTFIAEYVGATNSFDQEDLSFNGNGAKPQAVDAQVAYNFLVLDKPSFVAVGADHSWDSLALNLPEQSYFLAVGSNIFKDTLTRLEYRHDINYDSGDTASGNSEDNAVFSPDGDHRDTITADFEVFF